MSTVSALRQPGCELQDWVAKGGLLVDEDLSVVGDAVVAKDLLITRTMEVCGGLRVGGSARVSAPLLLVGRAEVMGDLDVRAPFDLTGHLKVGQNMWVRHELRACGTLSAGSHMYVYHELRCCGHVDAGSFIILHKPFQVTGDVRAKVVALCAQGSAMNVVAQYLVEVKDDMAVRGEVRTHRLSIRGDEGRRVQFAARDIVVTSRLNLEHVDLAITGTATVQNDVYTSDRRTYDMCRALIRQGRLRVGGTLRRDNASYKINEKQSEDMIEWFIEQLSEY